MVAHVVISDVPDKQVHAKVTKEIIDRALKANSRHCLLAEAVKVAFPSASRVQCDLQTCRVTDRESGLRYTYLTPRSAAVSLVNWDEGIAPKPFAFRLKGAQVTKTKSEAGRKQSIKKGIALAGETEVGVPSIRRIGGKTPPQLKRDRKFGLRVFVGAAATESNNV